MSNPLVPVLNEVSGRQFGPRSLSDSTQSKLGMRRAAPTRCKRARYGSNSMSDRRSPLATTVRTRACRREPRGESVQFPLHGAYCDDEFAVRGHRRFTHSIENIREELIVEIEKIDADGVIDLAGQSPGQGIGLVVHSLRGSENAAPGCSVHSVVIPEGQRRERK